MARLIKAFSAFFGRNVTALPLFPVAGIMWTQETIPMLPHVNPGFEITHLLSGQATWRVVNGPDLPLVGGQMSITQPEAEHGGQNGVMTPCRLFWFVFNPQGIGANRLSPFSKQELATFSEQLASKGNRTFQAPVEMAHIHQRVARLALQSKQLGGWKQAPHLVQYLRLELAKALVCALDAPDAPSSAEPAILSAAMAVMAVHLDRIVSIPEIAESVGTSTDALYRIFKQHARQTPAAYYHLLRLKQACTWLENGVLPITEISKRLGYSSSQYFANCFRRFTGQTPRDFRLHPNQATTALKKSKTGVLPLRCSCSGKNRQKTSAARLKSNNLLI
jgi:AraC family L-rhamnose operon regulatory protein RhaS